MIDELDFPLTFGEWLKRRRRELDLTQAELAMGANCTVFAVRKIEAGERRPSKQLAELFIKPLEIAPEVQTTFIKVARGELSVDRLRSPAPVRPAGQAVETIPPPVPFNIPFQPTPLVGREVELAALGKLLADPYCRLLTITGLGGIGKTRLAIELASNQRSLFSGGVHFVSLASLNAPEFIVPAIAEALGLSFTGVNDPQEQLLDRLAVLSRQPLLLVLDNLEHLLGEPAEHDGKDETTILVTELLQRLSNVKILATSRERCNLREEWVFELHGLPVPIENQTSRFEDFSAVTLFLQCARQMKADFDVLPDEWPTLARICQLVEGTPLAIQLAAAWVNMLSVGEIAREIATNLDFLTTRMRDVPERHRSLRAVFAHSWKLLSGEERDVLCRLAVFRGGFQRQAAEQVTGASLPILMSLLSKSLLMRRENGRYDLHALIQQCACEKLAEEKLRAAGYFEETCNRHLAYLVSMGREAQQGLRSAQQAEWLNRIEQEHNNMRAALEWAFTPGAPSERVEEGFCLITSIDRYWAARGHIHEGITWLERGLQASTRASLPRAKALRTIGWLYNHGDDDQMAIALLQESAALCRQLKDEIGLANALDTLADVAWRFGDFAKAKAYYAESLELLRKGGNPQSIGLSLASTGRMHIDYGLCQEAEMFLTEGLSFLRKASDLRGIGWCLNGLGRLSFIQGDLKLAVTRFREALRMNYELGYMIDISEGLHVLAVVKAIAGEISSATLLLAAATVLQERIGFTYPTGDPIYREAPSAWLQTAPLSKDWAAGEKMSLDQAVAYALEHEAG